ncbi:MAG: hypothetical protein AB7F59_11595 [Bdellovibrionales bacterium]
MLKNTSVTKLALYLAFSFLSVVVMPPTLLSATPKMKLSQPVAGSLFVILKGSEALHSSLYGMDHKKAQENVMQLIKTVEIAQAVSSRSENAETLVHLDKILSSIKNRLRDVQNIPSNEKERRLSYLKEFFQQLIQLTRLYDISHSYNVFFCPKDKEKGVWLQRSSKAQNPFDPEGSLKACGVMMR